MGVKVDVVVFLAGGVINSYLYYIRNGCEPKEKSSSVVVPISGATGA